MIADSIRSERRRRWLALLLFVLPAGCASDEELPPPAPESSPMRRRQRMLFDVESVVHRALQESRRDAARIVDEFLAAVDRAPRAYRLNTSDPDLATYGNAEQQARSEAVDVAEKDAETKLSALVEQYESALWDAAARAGQAEHGADLGTRTGYRELDDKVEAAKLQIESTIDIERLQQLATLKTYDDVALEREVRLEIEGVGIYSLFKSSPTVGLFAPGQEGQAVVAAFNRVGLDPKVPLSLVQARRQRVEHGNMVLATTPWQLEAWDAGKPGVVPERAAIDANHAIATEVMIPTMETGAGEFARRNDRILAREYLTALRRDDTGEIIATIGWQVRWNVDFHGMMRVLTEVDDLVIEKDPVLPSLLQAANAPQ
jgi:hypothetical protein